MRTVLEARALACGYPGRIVLTGIDLELRAGEVLALIGKNGSGKTTLFRTLAGELSPISGQALVSVGSGAARESMRLPPRERAMAIARVLQSERPAWACSVREYIFAGTFAKTGWFGAPGAAERSAVDGAIEATDLRDLESRPVTELSGGEFKRVLIARGLAQGASAILLDEPAADLDLARQAEILGLLRRLAESGVAVGLSVHDLNLASIAADRVALLAKGGLAAIGSPAEVITAERIADAYGAIVHVGGHPTADLPQISHAPPWLERR